LPVFADDDFTFALDFAFLATGLADVAGLFAGLLAAWRAGAGCCDTFWRISLSSTSSSITVTSLAINAC